MTEQDSHRYANLFCHHCNEEATHLLGTVECINPGDRYHSPAGTRGAYLAIPYWCESCHRTSVLYIGGHKGTTYLDGKASHGERHVPATHTSFSFEGYQFGPPEPQ